MLKSLTFEGRFECGLDSLVAGKVWAFVAVPGETHAAALGVAVAREAGYHPIPEFWCHADDHAVMRDHAEALNAERGLDPLAALEIVLTTLRGPFD